MQAEAFNCSRAVQAGGIRGVPFSRSCKTGIRVQPVCLVWRAGLPPFQGRRCPPACPCRMGSITVPPSGACAYTKRISALA